MTVELTAESDRYIFTCSYEEREIPKGAGFRWDPERKLWWTSRMENAAKLCRYAGDEKVAAELRAMEKQREESLEASRATDADLEIPAPEGLEYLPFQRAGIAYAKERDGVLIGDEMGCIDGDAILGVHRAGKGFRVRVADAYKRFHGTDRGNWNWDASIPTSTRSLCGDELRLNEVREILDKGVREVVELRLESGKTLKLTPDHRVVRIDEMWVTADELRPGDRILANGVPACLNPACRRTEDVITSAGSKYRGFCRRCMYLLLRRNTSFRGGKFIDGDGYVRVTGHSDHPRANPSGRVYEQVLVMEQYLGRFLDYPSEQVHHRNGDRGDNRIANLEVVRCSEHHRIHRKHRNFGGLFLPVAERVTEVVRNGEKVHVYDLVMADPHRSFVANGIIVHNCGKTIEAIGVMNLDPATKRVLVVCPASLKIVWKRELEKWLVHDLTVEIASSREPFPCHADVVVINYDILSKFRELFVPHGEKRYRYAGPEYDILVVDEAQAIKSSRARRSKLVRKIKAKKKLLLTGTPIVNRPIELWNLVNFLDPKNWHNFWFYAHRWCAAKHNGFGWDLSGASNLEELQRKLRETVMVRRLKKDVLTELPPKVRQIIELPANGHWGCIEAEREALRRREQQIEDARVRLELAKASGSDEEYRAAVTNLRECARVAFEDVARVRRETAVAKLQDAIPFLHDAVESSGKVVAFAHHHAVIERLAEEFGDRAVVVYGATALEERQERVDRFQNDPGCVLFIGSIQAAGVGLTLTAASHVVFLELDWVPGNMSQAEDRLHRISQRNSVLVQHLVLEDSIDARLAKTLIAKQAVIDRALDERIRAVPAEEEVLVPEGGDSVNSRRKDLAREGAELSPEQVESVHAALRQLAAVCDGATSLDGMGFNKIDTRVGRSLAEAERLSPRQAALGRRIVMKYRRQLPEELVQTIGKAS